MNPLTLAELNAVLGQTVGSLTVSQLEQVRDALNRRYWPQSAPETLNVIAGRWTS
jgi:hypothetical protein